MLSKYIIVINYYHFHTLLIDVVEQILMHSSEPDLLVLLVPHKLTWILKIIAANVNYYKTRTCVLVIVDIVNEIIELLILCQF